MSKQIDYLSAFIAENLKNSPKQLKAARLFTWESPITKNLKSVLQNHKKDQLLKEKLQKSCNKEHN